MSTRPNYIVGVTRIKRTCVLSFTIVTIIAHNKFEFISIRSSECIFIVINTAKFVDITTAPIN